jgi:LysM repeat protein
MRKRTRRSPARFLAPLALIAVVVALMAIISSSNKNGGTTSGTATSAGTTTSAQTTASTTTTVKKKKKTVSGSNLTASTYTVQVGDTLGGIAAKTGVSLATIQTLNPDVDPHAMVAGQKIKLK